MAQLPRYRAGDLKDKVDSRRETWGFALRSCFFVFLLALFLHSSAFAEESSAEEKSGGKVDLLGTWYVLVYYTDDNSANPDRMRWEDHVWVFEKSGSRIKWQQFPIVVFDDESGRFERRSTGQYARVLGAWEPSDSQLSDIRDGLQVNDRGSKQKTLRGNDQSGWKTSSRARPNSVSIVTYTENWTIEGLPENPVFERRDSMGGGLTDSLEGITRFAATRVLPSGNRLQGNYERDGTRHGTFRMMRSGPVGGLKKAAKSQREMQQRVRRRAMEEFEGGSPEELAPEEGTFDRGAD